MYDFLEEDSFFSVVIPTMWKYEPFYQFLDDLLSVSYIGEIIIIDNDSTNRPNLDVLKHHMIKLYDFGKNIKVNPAWNTGVEKAKYNKVCLLNDDLIFDLKLFTRIYPFVNKDRGVFGICPGVSDTPQPRLTNGQIDIFPTNVPYDPNIHFGFGMLMIFDKRNWIPIMDQVDVYWGDNFIFNTMLKKFGMNYRIANLFHHTPYGVTAGTFEDKVETLMREKEIYERTFPLILENIK